MLTEKEKCERALWEAEMLYLDLSVAVPVHIHMKKPLNSMYIS